MGSTLEALQTKGATKPIPGFRPDIEGFRAICVLAVVLYHAFATLVPGGFIGVDIFFVISGYLITQLLLNEYDRTGRIDLKHFVARRIRRILPVATLVLITTSALILLAPTLDPRELSRHVIAAALFYHNIHQAQVAVDYLASNHSENPLLHYWSLSVEEQFYLVWPLLLFCILAGLRRVDTIKHRRSLVLIIGGLWIASFAYSVHLTSTHRAWAYFDPLSRSFQLLSGSFIAAAGSRHFRCCATAVGIISLATILACFLLISPRHSYPGLLAAIPTLAATLLIHAGALQPTIAGGLLSTPLLRYTGRISFSWYLWHWPLLVFAHLRFGNHALVTGSAIAASFALAALSYRFVEQPFRHGDFFARSMKRTFALGAGLIALGVGTGIAMLHLTPDLVPVGNGAYKSAAQLRRDRPVIYTDQCMRRFADVDHRDCRYGRPVGSPTVVLFGDSHAGNWFEPVNAAAIAEGWELLVRIKASCRPLDIQQSVSEGGRDRIYTECTEWLSATLDEIARIKPRMIIVAGTRHQLPIAAETRFLVRLASVSPTVVIRDTPWFPQNGAACLRKNRDPELCTWPLASLLVDYNYPRTAAMDLPDNVRLLDLNRRICPGEVCRVVLDGEFVMFDEHHLTASFSRTLSDEFRALLNSAP